MHGAGFHRAEAGEMFEQVIRCAGFGAEFSLFSDADEFCVFKVAPVFINDFAVCEESMRCVADAAPVTVVTEQDVGGVMMAIKRTVFLRI